MSKAGRLSPSKHAQPNDFETALAELEAIVAHMEQGELPLEASLQAYRRGMELAAYCRKTLGAAEQQVKIIEEGVFKEFLPDEQGGDDAEP